ncbi:MAG: TolC family protein, partial [Bacteroidota bacterium]
RERVAQSAVTYFFDLLMAELDIQRSQADTRQTDTLLDMARKRLAIGTLTKDDVLELELQKIQSQQALQNAQLNYDNRLRILRSYIGLSDHQVVQLMLPEEVTPLKISVDEAIQRAHKDNPDLLQLRQNEMEAERDRDQTIRDNRFQASIDASFGLNQSDSTISSALTNLLDQQVVMVRLSIPLLDWGRRKNIQKVAEAKQMAVYEAGNQARQELDWELQRQVQRLDLLFGQIKANQKIDDLARARFQITQQRFFKGSVDLIKLSAARLAYVQAQQAYLQSLRAYWETLFAIRATTLYDFIAGSPIKVALD